LQVAGARSWSFSARGAAQRPMKTSCTSGSADHPAGGNQDRGPMNRFRGRSARPVQSKQPGAKARIPKLWLARWSQSSRVSKSAGSSRLGLALSSKEPGITRCPCPQDCADKGPCSNWQAESTVRMCRLSMGRMGTRCRRRRGILIEKRHSVRVPVGSGVFAMAHSISRLPKTRSLVVRRSAPRKHRGMAAAGAKRILVTTSELCLSNQ